MGKLFCFELWSNGEFFVLGFKWFSEQLMIVEGYLVGWRDGKMFKLYVDKVKNIFLCIMFNDYYFNSFLRWIVF